MNPLSPLVCRLIAIALMAGGAMAVAMAQTERRSTQVWRCGPEGRELRDAPCPESGAGTPGQQRIDYDQPSSAQSAEARRIAAREAKLARELERDRQRLEAQQAKQQQAIGIHGRGKQSPPPDAAQGAASAPKPLKTKKPKTHKPKPPKTNANTSG